MHVGDLFTLRDSVLKVIDKKGDYTLLENVDKSIPSPYIWAYRAVSTPTPDNKFAKISWSWGHYFDPPEGTLSNDNFKSEININEQSIEVYYSFIKKSS